MLPYSRVNCIFLEQLQLRSKKKKYFKAIIANTELNDTSRKFDATSVAI